MTTHLLAFPSGLKVRYDVELFEPRGSRVCVPALQLEWKDREDSMAAQTAAWAAICEWAAQRGEPPHRTDEEYVTQAVPWHPPFTERNATPNAPAEPVQFDFFA